MLSPNQRTFHFIQQAGMLILREEGSEGGT